MSNLANEMKIIADWLDTQAEEVRDTNARQQILTAAKNLKEEAFRIARVVSGADESRQKNEARVSAARKSSLEMLGLALANLPLPTELKNRGETLQQELNNISSSDIRVVAEYIARSQQLVFVAASVSLLASTKKLLESGDFGDDQEARPALEEIRHSLNGPDGSFLVSDQQPAPVQNVKAHFDEMVDFLNAIHNSISVSSSTMVDFIQLIDQVESVTRRIIAVGIKYRTLLLTDVQNRLKQISQELEEDIEDLEEFIKNMTLFATIITVIVRIVSLGM